jgi:hypothetical protein
MRGRLFLLLPQGIIEEGVFGWDGSFWFPPHQFLLSSQGREEPKR